MARIAIVGSPFETDYFQLLDMMQEVDIDPSKISSVVIGSSRGFGPLVVKWAHKNRLPVLYKYPDFHGHGKFAMQVRNREITNVSDVLVCIWDGLCPHTEQLIKMFHNSEKPYYIYMSTYYRRAD